MTADRMEWVWASQGEGAPWRRMDLDDWHRDGIRWTAGDTLYADAPDLLAVLGEIRDRTAPRAWLYVGPVLERWGYHWPDQAPWERPDGSLCDWGAMRGYGPVGGMCADERTSILVALCGCWAIGTMHHEVLHHVWRRLAWEERAILEEHGDILRAAGTPPDVRDPEWWERPEEAEARSYEMWASGLPQPHGAVPPAEVVEVWRRIAAGHVGRR